jgi:hypothetical protein
MAKPDSETDALVHEKIRMAWLNIHARELSITPVNCSGVALKFRDYSVEGIDLKDCVDQVMEAMDGKEPARFGLRPGKTSRSTQTSAHVAGAGL